MSVMPARRYVHHAFTWCPLRPEEDIGSIGIEVTDNCKLPSGSWELNPSPL